MAPLSLKQFLLCTGIYIGMLGTAFSNTPQTHDVPMFHNDDGLGLLQDCTFMKARAEGTITEIPTTVAGRSVGCLSASAELDWFEVLQYVVVYMEKQSPESLVEKAYGLWILESLNSKYPC